MPLEKFEQRSITPPENGGESEGMEQEEKPETGRPSGEERLEIIERERKEIEEELAEVSPEQRREKLIYEFTRLDGICKNLPKTCGELQKVFPEANIEVNYSQGYRPGRPEIFFGVKIQDKENPSLSFVIYGGADLPRRKGESPVDEAEYEHPEEATIRLEDLDARAVESIEKTESRATVSRFYDVARKKFQWESQQFVYSDAVHPNTHWRSRVDSDARGNNMYLLKEKGRLDDDGSFFASTDAHRSFSETWIDKNGRVINRAGEGEEGEINITISNDPRKRWRDETICGVATIDGEKVYHFLGAVENAKRAHREKKEEGIDMEELKKEIK